MWVLIVLTIVNWSGSKTTVAEYSTREICLKASKEVVPANYPGHYMTVCMPKLRN